MASRFRDQRAQQTGRRVSGLNSCVRFLGVLGLACLPGPLTLAADVRPGGPLRIALLVYQDADRQVRSLEEALSDLRAAAGIDVPLRVARGTYADVLHWLSTGAVDMAVVSPALLDRAMEQGGATRWEYLASVRTPSTPSPSLSVALVRDDSPVRTLDDLRRYLKQGEGKLIFVDPLSISGAVAPRIALAAEKIPVAESRVRYSHSHMNSLRALRSSAGRSLIAFVWSGLLERVPRDDLRTVAIPALARLIIPPDSVIVRSDLPQIARLREAVATLSPGRFGLLLRAEPDWREGQAKVHDWLDEVRGPAPDRLTRLDLDEVGELLLHYARSQPEPLRLAVVFSGGGAKCSYQIGAIRAIEEKLARLRKETGDDSLDVSLVVGTSGGAINALPVAMGMSSTPRLCDELDAVWRSLDQRDIIRPAFLVRGNMVLWFASLQFLCLSWLCRQRLADQGRTRLPRWVLLVAAGIAEVVLAHLPFDPFTALGPRPGLHRLYLWLSFGLEGAGWILLTAGVVGLALRARGVERRPSMLRLRRLLRIAAFGGMIVLPVVQAWTVLFHEPTLSESRGIENTLLDRFSRLVAAKLEADGRPGLGPRFREESSGRRTELAALSRRILDEGLLARDLVLTGSVLGERGRELPPDLYFWAPAGRTASRPSFGGRGVALANRPEFLLDALIGSGAIYPVFPARSIPNFPGAGQATEIVDGSYAHRSPIEAAVLWGATHIILIQADPDELVQRGGFASNIAAALTHLYEQAQLIDVRTREQAMIFSLSPQPPHIGLLDFASNLISTSLAKGYREVKGGPEGDPSHPPPFRKEVGLPHFIELPTSPTRAGPASRRPTEPRNRREHGSGGPRSPR